MVDPSAFGNDSTGIAEKAPRFDPCSIRRPPLIHEFASSSFDMEFQLVVKVTLEVAAPEGEISPPHRCFAKALHVYLNGQQPLGFSVALTTLPTASAKRAQVDSSR